MNEPRAPLESEIKNVLGFLDKHLRPGAEWSISAEYPQVFHPANRNNLRIISAQDQVLAHAAIKYHLIKNQLGIFKVAAIGSVVTDPSHRNQGLSQKILESCLLAAQKETADFAILWTDLFDYYRRFGFELAGTEISVVINSALQATPGTFRFMKSNKISPDAILRLYSQHTCTTMRTAEDIRKYLQIPNANVYTAWSTQNELLAYAVEGKGADLRGYIHEWGGGVSSLLPLLAHIRTDVGSPITMIAPRQSQNLIRHLQKWDVTCNHGYLGMIRPINIDNLFFKIHRYARNLGLSDFVLEQKGVGFAIGTKDDTTVVPDIGTLTRLIFGPLDPNRLKPQFQKIFPMPMWVWGWDSV